MILIENLLKTLRIFLSAIKHGACIRNCIRKPADRSVIAFSPRIIPRSSDSKVSEPTRNLFQGDYVGGAAQVPYLIAQAHRLSNLLIRLAHDIDQAGTNQIELTGATGPQARVPGAHWSRRWLWHWRWTGFPA
jgi:hypothetical protein